MKSIYLLLAFAVTTYAGTPKEATSPTKITSAASKSTAKTIVADVDGIVCAFCVQGIKKIFKSKGKAEEVVISLELKKVFVTEKVGQTITDIEFGETIRSAGFKVQSINRSSLTIAEVKSRISSKQPLVAQALAAESTPTATH